MTAILLIVAPRLAWPLATGGWGAHLLDVRSVRLIADDKFA